jgi:predicted dehydrogenase
MGKRKDPIAIGIIGCGRVAWERHLPALNHVPEARVVAAADISDSQMKTVGDSFKIPRRYTDYRRLLDDPEVAAVGILTPTGSHAEICLAALDAGKHVLVEKPLALTVEDCDRLISKNSASSKAVLVCFNLRWHHLIRQARTQIMNGELGKIVAVQSAYTHFRDGGDAPDWHRLIALGGGVTTNESVHHFDLWRYLTGESIIEVSAFHKASEFFEDETSVIIARLSGGGFATCFNSFRTSPSNALEIYGEKARMSINLYRFDGLESFPSDRYPGDIPGRIKKTPRSVAAFARSLARLGQGGNFSSTFVGIWKHFIDCIKNGKRPGSSLEDGRHAVYASLCARESFMNNCIIRLNG